MFEVSGNCRTCFENAFLKDEAELRHFILSGISFHKRRSWKVILLV
jgi:hypothetical protein